MRTLAFVVFATALSGCGSSNNRSAGPQDAAAGGAAGGSNPTGGAAAGGVAGGSNPTGGAAAGGAAGGSNPTGGVAAGGAAGGSNPTGGAAAGGAATGGQTGTCLGSQVLADLGKTHVLAGASMTDATAAKVKADLRYLYLSGGIFDGNAPCVSCASGCSTNGTSCANTAGCGWWGCWQYDQDPPGAYVRNFVSTAKTTGQIPMFTYYQVLQSSGVVETSSAEVGAVNNATFMARYFADFRFVLQNIGSDVALVHIEPDFWGYAEQVNSNPHVTPAAVASANSTDCAGSENSIAGLGRCMIAMARKYAPKVRIGLHASGWGTNMDVLANTSASFNVQAEAKKLAAFLVECGAATGDFLVADASDRDAGFYQVKMSRNTFWDATNATLPNFTQAFTWAKALAESAGTGVLWWQLPVGNMSLSNQANAWKDNRVDYFFGHTAELAASHSIGMVFGAGEGQQTTPESDGGNLVSKLNAYAASGGQAICP